MRIILILALVALSALCVNATIDVYPYAEGTTALDVATQAYIPTIGKDLSTVTTHDCGTLVTTLAAEFLTNKFEASFVKPLRDAYTTAKGLYDATTSQADWTAFQTYLTTNYPTQDTEENRLTAFKNAYRNSGRAISKTQWDKKTLKNEQKILLAVKWAMEFGSPKLVLATVPTEYPFGATQAALVSKTKTDYEKAANSITTASKALGDEASVVGVALVDVGTSAKPDVRAYFSPSGAEERLAGSMVHIEVWLPRVDSRYSKWTAITASNSDLSWKRHYYPQSQKDTDVKTIPSDDDPGIAGFKLIKKSTPLKTWWSSVADSTIEFGLRAGGDNSVGPTLWKKWYVPDPHAPATKVIATDSANLVGTCALQKLVYGLFSVKRPEFGNSELFKGAQSAAAAPKLICAAEAVAGKTISVVKKDGFVGSYTKGSQVPSCAACQAVLPSLMSKTKPVPPRSPRSRFQQRTNMQSKSSLQPQHP